MFRELRDILRGFVQHVAQTRLKQHELDIVDCGSSEAYVAAQGRGIHTYLDHPYCDDAFRDAYTAMLDKYFYDD